MPARLIVAVLLSGALLGCAASTSRQQLDLAPAGAGALPSASPTTQPAANADAIDVQQLSGQIVAGVKAELSSQIETAFNTTLAARVEATGVGRDVTGYHSEFGVGATLVVTLTLILVVVLSHRREVLRINRNGKQAA
ncbi:MAG: hypothetical protein CHACPFDD_03132 [Phycisphaerae bacterium]|nr:hypothetical protein [Phycisphaerae bacterium]